MSNFDRSVERAVEVKRSVDNSRSLIFVFEQNRFLDILIHTSAGPHSSTDPSFLASLSN